MRPRAGGVWLLCALMLARGAAAQTLDGATSELVTKILGDLKPHEISTYSLDNASTLDARDAAAVRVRLEAANLKPAATPAGADVRVTLAESFRSYVWVAEIGHGADKQVVLVEWPRPEPAAVAGPTLQLTLTTERVWEQEEPILDWTFLENRAGLLVLEPERLAYYRRDGANWTLSGTAPAPSVTVRDPRGRIALVAGTAGFTVYLPGGVCTGFAGSTLVLDCQSDAVPWPLETGGRQEGDAEFTSGRNYFDGRVSLGPSENLLPPFFSFAALERASDPVWIFAGVDGQARLYTPQLQAAGSITDWGSDIASVATSCGDGWQVLATARGDGTEPDAVRAYRIAGRTPVAASAPLEFPGPVTALWPAPDGKSVDVVAREVKTNRYAAFHLDISCAR